MKDWFCYRIVRPFRHVLQKIRYGISYKDCWWLPGWLAKREIKALKMFVNMNRCGIPAWLIDEDERKDTKLGGIHIKDYELIWDAIIWKIIDGLEMILEDGFKIHTKENVEYIRECLELFAESYQSLWD
jgi:hypothetical protein